MSDLAEKTIIVAGAGRGIGRAQALHFAKLGARVVVNDLGCDVDGRGRDETVANSVVSEIREQGGRAVGSTDDIRDPETSTRLIALALETFGTLDGVVASTGILREQTVLKTTVDDWEAVFATHVRGPLLLAQAAVRAMVDQKTPGSILLTSGLVAVFGGVRQTVHAAASAAVIGAVRALAAEVRRYGIRVNALLPTARTRTTENLPLFQSISPRSMGPQFVSPVAAFLLGDGSADVTGEVVGVAGSRLYTLRFSETPGVFSDEAPFEQQDVLEAWGQATKP